MDVDAEEEAYKVSARRWDPAYQILAAPYDLVVEAAGHNLEDESDPDDSVHEDLSRNGRSKEMITLNIKPLTDLCIATLAIYKHIFFKKTENASVPAQAKTWIRNDERCFSLSRFQLPPRISERLLACMAHCKYLDNHVFQQLCSNQNMVLQQVRLFNNTNLTAKSLSLLSKHTLTSLELLDSQVPLSDLLNPDILSLSTLSTLKCLTVDSGPKPPSQLELTGLNCNVLNQLMCLKSLSIVKVDLDNRRLSQICQHLQPTVRHLDISDNVKVTDISPIKRLSCHLVSLVMYNLYSLKQSSLKLLAYGMPELQHLDISCNTGHEMESFLNEDVAPLDVERLLCLSDSLRNIRSIDVSGREKVTAVHARCFTDSHPKLEFFGLLLTPASCSDLFLDDHNEHLPDLKITCLVSEGMIVEALKHYISRGFFVYKSLAALFNLVNLTDRPRNDLVQIIVKTMLRQQHDLQTQIAATACLYYLLKYQLAAEIHSLLLSQAIDAILKAMTSFPTSLQLQKNSILSLFNDAVLMHENIDRTLCGHLVMNCLVKFDDPTVTRMAVAIISILPAKMTTDETADIAANKKYMARLVEIVKQRVINSEVDDTLKFALSAIWNLTDESPRACECFCFLQGIELALDCLEVFSDLADPTTRLGIQVKVVGLLNNIAEVYQMREYLLNSSFLSIMSEALRSESIEYSYFSAGILANLLCDSSHSKWSTLQSTFRHLCEEMLATVSGWIEPATAMVAYRCFTPFLDMLTEKSPDAVKLWAVWAIKHVSTKAADKYVPMLLKENIHQDLQRVISKFDDNTHPKLQQITENLYSFILDYKQSLTNVQL